MILYTSFWRGGVVGLSLLMGLFAGKGTVGKALLALGFAVARAVFALIQSAL